MKCRRDDEYDRRDREARRQSVAAVAAISMVIGSSSRSAGVRCATSASVGD